MKNTIFKKGLIYKTGIPNGWLYNKSVTVLLLEDVCVPEKEMSKPAKVFVLETQELDAICFDTSGPKIDIIYNPIS